MRCKEVGEGAELIAQKIQRLLIREYRGQNREQALRYSKGLDWTLSIILELQHNITNQIIHSLINQARHFKIIFPEEQIYKFKGSVKCQSWTYAI